jgi:hypothetical protein
MIATGLLALALLEPEARASVTVDTSEVGADGPIIRRRILERSDVVLRRHGVLPSQDPDDVQIAVDVEEFDRGGPGFMLHLDIEALGHHEEIECALCTETELVARFEARLEVLSTKIAEAAAKEPEPDPAPDPVPEPTPQPVDDGKLKAMGKAGIALTVVGAVGVGVGLGLALNPERPRTDDPTTETTTQVPGLVTLGIGAAVLITGVALIIVDRTRAKKRRASVQPTVGPTGAALLFRASF